MFQQLRCPETQSAIPCVQSFGLTPDHLACIIYSGQVHLATVVSGLLPGATLTLSAGSAFSGESSCGWNVSSTADQRPITIRGAGPPAILIDCQSFGPVIAGVVIGPTHLRLQSLHFTNAQRSGGGGALLRAEHGSRIAIENCLVTHSGRSALVVVADVCVYVCVRVCDGLVGGREGGWVGSWKCVFVKL